MQFVIILCLVKGKLLWLYFIQDQMTKHAFWGLIARYYYAFIGKASSKDHVLTVTPISD